jgi:hypothetical protein
VTERYRIRQAMPRTLSSRLPLSTLFLTMSISRRGYEAGRRSAGRQLLAQRLPRLTGDVSGIAAGAPEIQGEIRITIPYALLSAWSEQAGQRRAMPRSCASPSFATRSNRFPQALANQRPSFACMLRSGETPMAADRSAIEDVPLLLTAVQ